MMAGPVEQRPPGVTPGQDPRVARTLHPDRAALLLYVEPTTAIAEIGRGYVERQRALTKIPAGPPFSGHANAAYRALTCRLPTAR